MDMGLVRGLLTLAVFLLFLGITWYSYSAARKPGFDAAARMPLADDGRDSDTAVEDKDAREAKQ